MPLLPRGFRLTHSLNIFNAMTSDLSDTICSSSFIETLEKINRLQIRLVVKKSTTIIIP